MPRTPLSSPHLFSQTSFHLVIGVTMLSLIFLAACGGFSGGSTTLAPTPAQQPTISSSEFLYVVSSASRGFGFMETAVSSYKIGSDGSLQSAPAPFTGQAIHLIPSTRFIFAAWLGTVRTLSIDPATGTLTQVAATQTPVPFIIPQIAVDPAGKFLYTHSRPAQINVFAVNASTGALTSAGDFAVPAGFDIAMDPAGKFLYEEAADASSNPVVAALPIDNTTGALGAAKTSPVVQAEHVIVAPNGKFAYLFHQTPAGDLEVTAFMVDATSGAFTASGTLTLLNTFPPEAIDPMSRFLYAGSPSGVHSLQIDPVTGALHEMASSPLNVSTSGTVAVQTEPSGIFLYTVNGDKTISTFAIDAGTGALKVQGSAVPLQSAFPSVMEMTTARGQ
jgi:6-phosphogluconolactonase (cycloisomerase 2 family)